MTTSPCTIQPGAGDGSEIHLMAVIDKQQLISAFHRLGQLASVQNQQIELLLVGGSAMVLGFDARFSTRDVDVLILAPQDRAFVRTLVELIATERGWPTDWLNDGAKGFLHHPVPGRTLLAVPGLVVHIPIIEQLLAMKLCAWRDDVDIEDATRLLRELSGDRGFVWNSVAEHLQPGRELKAKYAFEDLWDDIHGAT